MVPVGKNKVDDAGSVDSKRPAPYSLPQKPNWMAILNGGQNISQKLLRPVELKVTNNNKSQKSEPAIGPTSPETPAKAFPVPMPRMGSSSSNDSEPKTPVPLPRTKFNLPPIDPSSLERSASFPETAAHPEKPQLSHSNSCPNSNYQRPKVDNETVDSALPTVSESSATVDSTPQEEVEDEINTWL